MDIKFTKQRIFEIIETTRDDDRAGKIFDIFLLSVIIINMVLVVADTFKITHTLHEIFHIIEIICVIIFIIEYIIRIWTCDLMYPDMKKWKARFKFVFSFMAIIDLLAIFPFFMLIMAVDLRILRILRIFRLLRFFKINRYFTTFNTIGNVFKKKMSQLLSSVFIIFMLMVIVSVLMYNVEHTAQPGKFDNAFSSFWWAMATLTTIGYGDIYPITFFGQILNGIFAFLGIGLIAVPTGIISAGFVEQNSIENESEKEKEQEKCFCPYCGQKLDE